MSIAILCSDIPAMHGSETAGIESCFQNVDDERKPERSITWVGVYCIVLDAYASLSAATTPRHLHSVARRYDHRPTRNVWKQHCPTTMKEHFVISTSDIRPEYYCIRADSFGRILPDAATEQIRAGSRVYVW